MEKLIVIRYGEIALKGNNRQFFEAKLLKNMKEALKPYESAKVTKEHGRLFVTCDQSDYDLVLSRVGKIYGIVSYSPAVAVSLDLKDIETTLIEQVGKLLTSQKTTFKMDVKRSNKGFFMTSPQLAKHLGGMLLSYYKQLKVDVHHPELTATIEVRDRAFIFTEVIRGQGGMPYKTGGKGMLLLSGGIDSPVAGYMMAKRGIEIEAVHFHSYPFTSERAQEKVWELARKMAVYTKRIRVNAINLLEIQKAIAEKCPSEEMTILSRRFMMALATRVAKDRGCQALITGESLGQVASQTIEGIAVTTDATDLPILRPLIAMDKVDITLVAKEIDTFETSILPYEDCCTVFLPDKVVTKPKVQNIKDSEALLDAEALIESALATMEVHLFYEQTEFEL